MASMTVFREKIGAVRAFLLAVVISTVCMACVSQGSAWAAEGEGDAAGQLATASISTQANSSITEATAISLNASRPDSLTSSVMEHWYKVTLPSAGRFEITFKGSYAASGTWGVSLRDGNNEEISYTTHNAADFLAGNPVTSVLTGLPAGTFFIKVNDRWDGGSLVNLSYELTPKFTASTVWETELNDSVTDINAISLDSATSGTLRSGGDQDWYKVTLPSAGSLEVAFKGTYSANGTWAVSLRDGDNNEISYTTHDAADYLAGNAATSVLTGLPAGSFFIRVSARWDGDSLVNLPYELTPKFTASSTWETELNDSVIDVDAIPIGSATSGTLRSGGDQDWYKVTLLTSGTFQLTFKGTYKSDGTWGVSLRDGDNKEISYSTHDASSFNAGNPATSVSTTLAAGTYFICVTARWSGDYLVNLPYELTPYKPETIEDAAISAIPAEVYTGVALEPRPIVTLDGKTLEFGADYTLSYENNTDAGNATVVVQGAGKYFGSKTVTFTIKKAPNPGAVTTKTASIKRSKLKYYSASIGAERLFVITGAINTVKFKKASGSKRLKLYSDGTVAVKKKTKKGIYQMQVKVTLKGDQNHKKRVVPVTLQVKVK